MIHTNQAYVNFGRQISSALIGQLKTIAPRILTFFFGIIYLILHPTLSSIVDYQSVLPYLPTDCTNPDPKVDYLSAV
jgi:hypothetical protein